MYVCQQLLAVRFVTDLQAQVGFKENCSNQESAHTEATTLTGPLSIRSQPLHIQREKTVSLNSPEFIQNMEILS